MPAQPLPVINPAEIAAIRSKVGQKTEPWFSAYRQLVAAADEVLLQEPIIIKNPEGDHLYRADAKYLTDGIDDPEADQTNLKQGRLLGARLLDLAYAYLFTSDKAYAEKAVSQINTWCLDPKTYMKPTGQVEGPSTPGRGATGDIAMFALMDDLFYTANLIWDCPAWTSQQKEGMQEWTEAMVVPQKPLMYHKGRLMTNNWEDARLLYLCKGACLLGDQELLDYVFTHWQEIMPRRMKETGELPRETERTRSLHYSFFALDSATQVAEIARHNGVNLYDYEAEGKSLKLAYDFVAKYLRPEYRWPYKMVIPLDDEYIQWETLEPAYSHYQDPMLLEIITRYPKRPITARHTTLVHGNRFELGV